jgi:hypothetical protein
VTADVTQINDCAVNYEYDDDHDNEDDDEDDDG